MLRTKAEIAPIKVEDSNVGISFVIEGRGDWPWWKRTLFNVTFKLRKCDIKNCRRRARAETLFGEYVCHEHFAKLMGLE